VTGVTEAGPDLAHAAGMPRLVILLLLLGACARGGQAAPPAPPPPPVAPVPAPRLATADVASLLLEPVRLRARHQRFGQAVERISTALGQPISAEEAMRDRPCGGWSGPGCSGLTYGLEALKLAAPILTRLYADRLTDVARVLAEAVSIHSIWHDAFGYVHGRLGLGAGYVYAGCLMSSCSPGEAMCGHLDGVLYQVGRLVGVIHGPECGPGCTLAE
jgi:hypothetical protein